MGHIVRFPLLLWEVLLGTLSALAGLVFLVTCGPVLAWQARPGGGSGTSKAGALAVRMARFEARRLRVDMDEGADAGRATAYLAARIPLGVLGGLVLSLLELGAANGIRLGWAWVRNEPFDGMLPTPPLIAYIGLIGIVLLFLEISGLVGVRAVERGLARRMLAPDPTVALRRRIEELAETRAGIVAAVDAERRRIERDLHDGLQQRLVALSMLIGRARRGGRTELLAQAHEDAQRALAELREVAWRAYPSGLDTLGLADALAGVAERSSVPVHVRCDLAERPPMAVETAAYFVVSESVTNAAKHAAATGVSVEIRREGTMIVVRIEDDGCGGAVPTGGGLSGLARRVAALDGRLGVDSPHGGPTVITAELPCG
ncbi:sensor histidine kinase [Nonomuraea typhae]|uniref:sensor histidine kinase n=1 Tax=Nonomuraea typhae TaxID=2603600 RepID=UPI001C936A89|nr:histidine kinase [Nonomuraea typhae]